MHDSLPKVSTDPARLSLKLNSTQGDLDELLGVVNPHVYRRGTDEPPSLPTLPTDAAHPYHIVVM